MQYILALRSFGDFVILINSLIHSEDKNKYTIIASIHLKSLYDSLNDFIDLKEINILFIDLKIKNGLLNLFTIKYFFSIATFKQVRLLKNALKQLGPITKIDLIVEKEERKLLLQFLLNIKLKCIVKRNYSVYEAFNFFFKSRNYLYKSSLAKGDLVAIVPISRLEKKNLPVYLVNDLVEKTEASGLSAKIYSFKNRTHINATIYDNFTSLINLIINANFIVCADSLQAHLSYLFKKPHFIFFSKNSNRDFLTPFASNFDYYASFDKSKFTFLDLHNDY
jgi:ADP-heptose:LPS heptosyltransferase